MHGLETWTNETLWYHRCATAFPPAGSCRQDSLYNLLIPWRFCTQSAPFHIKITVVGTRRPRWAMIALGDVLCGPLGQSYQHGRGSSAPCLLLRELRRRWCHGAQLYRVVQGIKREMRKLPKAQ